MKQLVYLLTLIALIVFVFVAQARWQLHRLPGGTALETIVVDEFPTVQGLWVVEKHGGMYWLEWDPEHPWGEDGSPDYQEFDAYYRWWMGGDVQLIDGTPYAIAATYRGTHLYEYNTTSEKWETATTPTLVPNAYYRWNDVAFCADQSGNYNEDMFILSAVQAWRPPGYTYHNGLFLVTNGQCPGDEEDPIQRTRDHMYEFIYRHPDPEEGHLLYTWFGGTFQVVTVSGNYPSVSAVASPDFSPTSLTTIKCFYQYKEGNTSHQFIVADQGQDDWDVWHRTDLGSTIWSIVCQDLQDEISAAGNLDFKGIVAYYQSGNPGHYYIYLNISENGLALIEVPYNDPDNWSPVWLNWKDTISNYFSPSTVSPPLRHKQASREKQ